MDTIFGDAPIEMAQMVIGHAWRQHTKESMLAAALKIEGMRMLVADIYYRKSGGLALIVRLNAMIQRCHQAANMIERGEL
jgi:hypothetical protein